jgi:hypothetical protein
VYVAIVAPPKVLSDHAITGSEPVARCATFGVVDSLAASHPWTYWLAIPLCIADAFLVAGIAIGYLVAVVLPRRRLRRDRSLTASTR